MSRYRFWLIVIVLVALLTILLLARPEVDTQVLLVRNAYGEAAEIFINDLLKLESVEDAFLRPVYAWYDRYSKEKGENLLRVFEISQIIELTGFENQDFTLLRFDSTDGASVVIQPRDDKDSLILMTLEREKDDLSLRLIMPMDSFSQRWLKNVVRISMENGEWRMENGE